MLTSISSNIENIYNIKQTSVAFVTYNHHSVQFYSIVKEDVKVNFRHILSIIYSYQFFNSFIKYVDNDSE